VSALFAAGLFQSGPVLTAFVVGGFVSVVTAVVGVFTVTRGQSFAGHSLADLGAVGGSAAFFVGISQIWGFVAAGVIAALLMEVIGVKRIRGRDVATGIVLGSGLGLTALFLYWDTTISNTSNAAISVLFGSLFVINASIVPIVIALSVAALVIVGVLYRPLKLESVDPDLAQVRGSSVRLTGILFLVALALAVALSSLSIGAILSTVLLIGPAAAALRLTHRVGHAVLVAAALGLASTWVGIVVSYDSYDWFGAHHNWPVSFCIVVLVLIVYLISGPVSRFRDGRRSRVDGLRRAIRLVDAGGVGS
jgi:zinc/manganese transport system permease protein